MNHVSSPVGAADRDYRWLAIRVLLGGYSSVSLGRCPGFICNVEAARLAEGAVHAVVVARAPLGYCSSAMQRRAIFNTPCFHPAALHASQFYFGGDEKNWRARELISPDIRR